MSKIFRFDDISRNTNLVKLREFIDIILNSHDFDEIWLCYSPFAHDPDSKYHPAQKDPSVLERERVFPSILKAISDHRLFYHVDNVLDPQILMDKFPECKFISHGLVHVDHRLLSKTAQEMSILIGCALARSKIFIPPFNHYNKKTEKICKDNGIDLIKFEDGWLHVKHNKRNRYHEKYYVHTFDITTKELESWMNWNSI